MRIGNVQNGLISTEDPKFIKLPADGSMQRFALSENDILVSLTGNVGRIGVIEKRHLPAALNQRVARITCRKDSPATRDLLLHFLCSDLFKEELIKAGHGAAQQNVSTKDLIEIEIHVPPIEEQRRIVTLLDEAFADIATAKANAEKNLKNARTLFISYLQSGYHQQSDGWTASRIADIAKHSLGKMLDKAKNRGDLKPYLRNLNVRWFDFDLSDVQEMKFTPEESGKYTAIKGDVLICEGGYPGRCAIWEDVEPIYFQKALHRVRFHNPLHSKWFVNYLYLMDQTGDLKNHFSGTGIQHFTGEALAKFTLPIPPDQQIQQLLDMANQLEIEVLSLESIYRQKLIALDDLKKSLLHQAFSGQL